jgi:type 1 glutamine amidotransferase
MSLLLITSFCFAASPAGAGDKAPKEDVRVLLTYGGHGFQQEPFFAMFDALPGVACTKAPLPEKADLLKPGLQQDFDVIVMYDMVRAISPAQQEAFVALLKEGIGLVSLHHNIGAHRGWDEFPKIIGGKWIFQPQVIDGTTNEKSVWAHGQDMHIKITDPDHPITKGLSNFDIHDETYGKFYTSPKVRVLIQTDHPKNDPEIAWVHQYGNSRVCYFMLGHDSKSWGNPAFPEILNRCIRWAAGR